MSKREPISDALPPKKKAHLDPSYSELGNRYEREKTQYAREGFSQDVELLLKRLSLSALVPKEIKQQPLMIMLVDTTKLLLLNEIEVSLWALILEQTVWTDKADYVQDNIMFAAYATKQYLNRDCSHITYSLNARFEMFEESYNQWFQLKKALVKFNAKMINAKFNELSLPPSVTGKENIDYNFYVDDILVNNPTSIEKTLKKTEVSSEEIDPELLFLED